MNKFHKVFVAKYQDGMENELHEFFNEEGNYSFSILDQILAPL